MSTTGRSSEGSRGRLRAAPVILVSSVMFTFISYWRTAAVVLCDMSSTVFYIGAIVESAIGKAAPWFILAVLFFSYGMRSVYIESCSLFVRGGVYRVVKEAMGGLLAKVSVSALLFDYILTGPISGVSAGQYIVGLVLETLARFTDVQISDAARSAVKSCGSVLIACAITLYFFRQNLLGIRESSGKALKIMIATTIMGVIMLIWSSLTLATKGAVNDLPPATPDLREKFEIDGVTPKINHVTGEQEDPLGFLTWFPGLADALRSPESWWSVVGIIGLVIAFGHSILAMSGEETLAQVYREVESPKLPNFKKAAFVVFLYSLLLTGSMSFLAVLLIPDQLRMTEYYDNFIGGLAMQMVGPVEIRLLLNAFVVVVGFLILSGAVNTSIIGSNGVLNRVAEDGVLPDWFLRPHHRYGTSSRILYLVTGLQLVTIIASRGDVILLGEAYAFGVVWSFVFKTLSMVMLRFKDPSPREFKVPGNVRLGSIEIPIGLGVIFVIVFLAALSNLLTKPVATVSGLIFTTAFLTAFIVTERAHERRRRGGRHEHLEQFNRQVTPDVTAQALELHKPYRQLVAIRSPHNLFMLEKTLAETDPETTDVIVMTAKVSPPGGEAVGGAPEMDDYDQQLMTAVVERAEKAGKKVKPVILRTNNPLHAVLKTAKDLGAQEVIVGMSNKFTAEEQLDQIAFYWISLHDGKAPGLTVRILSRDRDVTFDLEGGSRIPKIGERRARSVDELRRAGVGVDRVLLVLGDDPANKDLFQAVLTMLDDDVKLSLVGRVTPTAQTEPGILDLAQEQAKQLSRELHIQMLNGDAGPEIVRLAREGACDLIIVGLPSESTPAWALPSWLQHVLRHAHCPVFLAAQPGVPQEVTES